MKTKVKIQSKIKKNKRKPVRAVKRIGILGGGQLAQMLSIAGQELGFETYVLSESSNDPAAKFCTHWQNGNINDREDLIKFFKSVDVVTIESEFLQKALLINAQKISGTKIFPDPKTLDIYSDRSTQKKWLKTNRIPTSRYIDIKSAAQLRKFLESSPEGIVLKKRRFGYDGFGTNIIKSKNDLEAWINDYQLDLKEYIAEQWLNFDCELAIQFSCDGKGRFLQFPLVEWKARNSKCHWVKGPINSTSHDKLIKIIVKALKKQKYTGAIAFEFFDCSGNIFVNEVAPRVHNSGHHTIESCRPDQFQAHWFAGLGKIEKSAKVQINAKAFAMINLIGIDLMESLNLQIDNKSKTVVNFKNSTAVLHWYGKKENRPGRKMGHATHISQDLESALKPLLDFEKTLTATK